VNYAPDCWYAAFINAVLMRKMEAILMAVENDRTTIGVFTNHYDAEIAVHEIKKMGLGSKELSIIVHDDDRAKELAAETGTRVAQGAAAGAGTGAVAGGTAGLLLGLAALAIPGIGPVLAAGPLATALGATAAGAAVGAGTGGIVGALTGMGVSREEAERYEEAVRKGDVLVAVGTHAENDEAVERTLERYSARDVKTVGVDLGDISVRRRGEAEA
jgi:hypothetical protein